MTSTLTIFVKLMSVVVLISMVQARHCPKYHVQHFSRVATDPSGLSIVVNKFKRTLGGNNNGNTPGPLHEGQRSINWDAAPLPFDMPFDFFNTVATRGAIFQAKGNEFRVSNTNNASDIDDRFNTIVPDSATSQFQRFSPLRLFTPLKGNRVSVTFRVPATSNRAGVAGFGAVFVDVDFKHATHMRFFDSRGCIIAHVPVLRKSKGLSFAGIVVRNKRGRKAPVIAKVSIRLGNVAFARYPNIRRSMRKFADLVVLDDLLYAEPKKLH